MKGIVNQQGEKSKGMIADRLRLARRKAGLSLRNLSAAMDSRVTAQAIGKYERAESVPSSGCPARDVKGSGGVAELFA